MYLRVKMKNHSDGMDIYGEPAYLRTLLKEMTEELKKGGIYSAEDWTIRLDEVCSMLLKDIEPEA